MIKVHKFGPAFGLPDGSPFVMKVETYLRITDQKYEVVLADVRKAPRQQLPVIEVDGKVIPDSTAIVDLLESKRETKLDAHLSAVDRAIGQAFKSMLEEHLYFGILFMRWSVDEGFAVWEPKLREMLAAGGVPSLLRGMVLGRIRKGVVERTNKQGIGRMPRAEVVASSNKVTDAFSDYLGGRTFFMGDKPTTLDATAYAFAAALLCPAWDNELRKHAAEKKNLVDYEKRMKDAYWKEG
jgi:glutathione S-transferase